LVFKEGGRGEDVEDKRLADGSHEYGSFMRDSAITRKNT
jgi:hypothetical protein